ncbi:phage tail protein [Enterobacter hormaechei]|uniref:phage tail tip fiber protein n=1 Tax=Enterobacter hormaechei TaxID=158836 RepID=UPI0006D97661|nr:phage tail protein [Enterobacter hormaechei]KPR16506.1 host specificity protein J [Enterobacter hormaechei]
MATVKERRLLAGSGGGSKGGGSARTPVEDKDNVQSRSLASILDLLGEGKIGGLINGGQSIFLDNVPILNPDGTSNFNGVTWWFRDGTQNQAVIEGFDAVETPHDVGVQIKLSTPRTIQIDNDDSDQVRVIMMFPKLTKTDRKSGDTHGTTVQFQFEIAYGTTSFKPIKPQGYASHVVTLSKKSSGKHYREYLFDLPKPGSNYRIRVSRVTADSTTDYIQDQTWLSQYGEIVSTKLNYPNSALVGLKIDSQQFGSSVPARSYLVSGMEIRVPSNYDPVLGTYSGDWDGTFRLMVSDNPAWILYDLLTSKRYGLGEYVTESMINIGQLYQIGRYCDELINDGFGGKEKRFAINTVINSRGEAYKVLQDIVSTFRGMIFWAGGMVNIMQDSPSSPVMQFSAANIIGKVSYKGSSRKDRATIALITYNDKDDLYKQNIEYVEDEEGIKRFGVRKTESVAFGCTSRGQAHRVGLWTLYSNRMETDLITFTSGMDASLLMPGELVKLQDKFRSGKRNSGRLVNYTKNSITLDASVKLTKAGNTISFLSAKGKMIDRDLIEGTGEYTVVTFKKALTEEEYPAIMGIWSVIEPNLEPMLLRVLAVNQNEEKGAFDIVGVQHNPTKFNAIDEGATLVPSKTTILDPTFSSPENLQVTEGTYVSSPGNLSVKLMVSWEGKSPSYVLRYRRSDVVEDWVTTEVNTEQFDILNAAENGMYDIELYSISATGRRSSVISMVYTTLGTMTPPDAPTLLTAIGDYRVNVLAWQLPGTIDIDKINVYASRTNDLTTASLIAAVASTTFTHSGLGDDETWFYWVRAVNKRGMLSQPNSSLGTEATTKDVLSFLKNKITSSELGQDLLADIDQSATKEAVEEVSKRIDDSVGELHKAVDEIDLSITGVKQSVIDMQNSFDGMEKEQSDLKANVQDTADKVSQALGEVDDATANVLALQETVKKQGESVASTLDAAQAALDGSKTLIAEERQARVDGDTAIGKKVETLQSVVDTGQANIDEMKQTVASVEKSASQWSTSLEANAKANIDLALRQEEDKKQQASTNASVTTSQQALTDSVSSVAKRVDEIKAEIGDDIAAQLQEERETRASADEAVTTQITQLKAQVNDDVKASLATEQQARADADSALSKQVTNLQSQVNTDVKAQIAAEAKTRADKDSALSSQITALSAQVNDDVTAQIATESKARTDGDTAISTKVDTLATKTTSDIKAAVATETKARTDGDTALGSQITSLKTQTASDIKAAVATETKARTDGDSALSSQISSLKTQTAADIKAAVATETKARTDGDTALGSQITSLKTQTAADIKAAIATETKARSDADSAMASDITALETRAGKIESSVTSEQTARANADTALGKRVDTVSAKADSASSTVQQTSQAVANVNSKVSASWTLKMETSTSNGQKYAAGMALGIDGSGLSQFLIRADRFGLVNSVDGKVTTPFVVQNSVAYMNGAYIKDGTIVNAKIGDLQSTNYVSGRTGWRIAKGGAFEMNGNSGSTGRMVINNNRIEVYDENGRLRVRMGLM